MLDGDTPNPGITIILEKTDTNDNYKKWRALTNENGKFKINPNKGNYHIAYFIDDVKKYVLDKENNKETISFNGKNKIEKEFTISSQVKGSWKK